MNILCPNCQKPISVDERYAGQLMKCPLCAGTFTVPLLPDAAATPRPAAPSPATVSSTSAATMPATPREEGYGLAPEPAPAPAPPPFTASTAPPPFSSTASAARPDAAAPPSPPPLPPGGYVHVRTLRLNPEIVPWIPPAALVLVFIFTFFPWLGAYPHGLPLLTQSGWQAAFGSYSGDWTPEKNFAPGAAGILIFDLILLLLPTVILTVAVALFHFKLIHVQMPPLVQQAWPWRHWIVAGAAFLTFLFLAIQIMVRFPLESALVGRMEKVYDARRVDPNLNDAARRQLDIEEAQEIARLGLRRTWSLRLVFCLELIAVIAALLDGWLERRGKRPYPQIQIMW
jgi:hypothetical protein